MPKGKKGSGNRIYWTAHLDQVIDQYNQSTDPDEREHLFREHLDYPLDKMAENIINRFKFPYINNNFEETKQQVVSFLVMNLSKYNSSKAKSFSYFSVIAKNYLILHNNNGYKQEKRSVYFSDTQDDLHVPIEEMIDLKMPSEEERENFREFIDLMINYWDANIPRVFKKKRDADIAYAVIELFRRADKIENFNKKALYLMIREMTDCKTGYITKIVNKMRFHVMKQFNQYQSEGEITEGENKFFSYIAK
jgi:hypothetical protein